MSRGVFSIPLHKDHGGYTLKNHQTTTQETMQPSPSGQ